MIGQPVGLVEEHADSLHLVVPPLTLVETSVLVVELAETVLLSIEFVTLIFASLAVEFGHIYAFWVSSRGNVKVEAIIWVGVGRFVVGWELELIEMVIRTVGK